MLLLGSNCGERPHLLANAVRLLSETIGEICAVSPTYNSPPWGFDSDSDFLNQAILIESSLAPKEVLASILVIEESLGRKRSAELSGYTSRTMDIDIIHWSGGIIAERDLLIPHPRVQDRRFALTPICDIAGEWVHPHFNSTYLSLLASCKDDSIVCKAGLQ